MAERPPDVAGLATMWLVLLFAAGAVMTWMAGVVLSKSTDALDVRLNLGAELGGLLLLAIAGSLPEVAITVSAAAHGDLGLAAGNLIGGIAVQTMVLVFNRVRQEPRWSVSMPGSKPGRRHRREAHPVASHPLATHSTRPPT